MSRPKHENPTPGELAVLNVLWARGASTGRDVMTALNADGKDRAYTSVTSLLNVMSEKGLVVREPAGRAFVYAAKAKRESTLREMLRDMLSRAFEGSASALVAQLLSSQKLSQDELDAIRRVIDEHHPPSS